jgi:hypothetical protein
MSARETTMIKCRGKNCPDIKKGKCLRYTTTAHWGFQPWFESDPVSEDDYKNCKKFIKKEDS